MRPYPAGLDEGLTNPDLDEGLTNPDLDESLTNPDLDVLDFQLAHLRVRLAGAPQQGVKGGEGEAGRGAEGAAGARAVEEKEGLHMAGQGWGGQRELKLGLYKEGMGWRGKGRHEKGVRKGEGVFGLTGVATTTILIANPHQHKYTTLHGALTAHRSLLTALSTHTHTWHSRAHT